VEPSVFLEAGPVTLSYDICNEGWLDETYNYRMNSRFGWFSASGSIDIDAGESETLDISGTLLIDQYPDKVQLIVTPAHAPARADTTILYVYSTQSSVSNPSVLPTAFALFQNYPNPFNPETNILFNLPEEAEVELRIYNIQGRLVRSLVHETRAAGQHAVRWDGRDDSGREVASGVYFYELRADRQISRKRMVLLK
jgi:hypothetical protein